MRSGLLIILSSTLLCADPLSREIIIESDYLNFPLLDREEKREPGTARLTFTNAEGQVVRSFHAKFPKSAKDADFIHQVDVTQLAGQKITFAYESEDDNVLSLIEPTDDRLIEPDVYSGANRPKFHFSPRRGWMNDVNGTHFHNGLYHLFYQSNPTITAKSPGFDMHWGHSVSKDLVHWEEWPVALYPDQSGAVFSGTAAMVRSEIPQLTQGDDFPQPILFFTATSPFSQHIAKPIGDEKYWERFGGNPVIENIGKGDRDPKIIWHEPSQHYAMLLYIEDPKRYEFFRSKNLTDWENVSTLADWHECPEFFEVVSPTTGETLYLLYGSYRKMNENGEEQNMSSAYQLGKFDGKTFTPVTEVRTAHNGWNFYGALTFMNEPKGRQVMMGWAAGTEFPGEPFNQCATIPLELTLEDRGGKDTLCMKPVEEISQLRTQEIVNLKNLTGREINEQLKEIKKTDLLDIEIEFAADQTSKAYLWLRDRFFSWDPSTNQVEPAMTAISPTGPVDGRFLVDNGIIEGFWNGGEIAHSVGSLVTAGDHSVHIAPEARVNSIRIWKLKNIWK